MSLLDMIQLNNVAVPRDSVRGERNMHTLAMFAAGLVFELGEGIQQLEAADIVGHLSKAGRERWERLVRIANPKTRRTMKHIRNLLAFHVGDPEVYTRGIARLAGEHGEEDRPLAITLMTSDDDGKRVHARRDLGLAVLLAGTKVMPEELPDGTPDGKRWITDEDMVAALTEATDGHMLAVILFDDLLLDALREAGAELSPLGPMTEPVSIAGPGPGMEATSRG